MKRRSVELEYLKAEIDDAQRQMRIPIEYREREEILLL